MQPFNRHVTIGDSGERAGTGWLPPLPDLNDYTPNHKN